MGQELHPSSVTVLPEQRMPPPWTMPNARAFRSQPRATRPMSRDSRRRTPGPADGPKTVTRESCCRGLRSRTFRRRRPSCSPRGEPTTKLAAAQERRRQQEEAGVLLSRVVYDAVHGAVEPGARARRALLFESRFESGNLRRVIHVCENEYDLLLNWDHGTRGHTSGSFSRCVARCRASRMLQHQQLLQGLVAVCIASTARRRRRRRRQRQPAHPHAHAAAALQLGRRAATEQPRAPRRPGIAMDAAADLLGAGARRRRLAARQPRGHVL